MKTLKKAPSDIDGYLQAVAPAQRAFLKTLRQQLHRIVPDLEECISYGMPAFRWHGKVVAGFAATARGASYYPFSGTTLSTLAEELKGRSMTKSALHLDITKPVPKALVAKLLKARMAEITP